jgi:hypothetical protein
LDDDHVPRRGRGAWSLRAAPTNADRIEASHGSANDTVDLGSVEERVGLFHAIDELIDHHELSWVHVRPQMSRRRRA